jgi:hypothetical protein
MRSLGQCSSAVVAFRVQAEAPLSPAGLGL